MFAQNFADFFLGAIGDGSCNWGVGFKLFRIYDIPCKLLSNVVLLEGIKISESSPKFLALSSTLSSNSFI